MNDPWVDTELDAHVELFTGPAFVSAKFRITPPGIKLLRGDNVTEGSIRWGNKTRYWPELTQDIEKYLLQEGDVIIGMDGSKVGYNRAQMKKHDLPCLLVQIVARLKARNSIDQKFLAYIVLNKDFWVIY